MSRKLSPSFCCHAPARLRLWNRAKIIFSSRNAFGVGDRLRFKAVSVDERQRFLGDQPNEPDDNRRNDPQRLVFNDGDVD